VRQVFLPVTVAVFCALSFPVGLARAVSDRESLFAQASPKQDACDAYYTLQPLDAAVLKLLGTPVFPASSSLFTNAAYLQLRDWDFPPKVTSWQERPKPEEIARRREELMAGAGSSGGKDKSKNASLPASAWLSGPYGLEPFSSRDWNDLQKWFAKEAPKKLAGVCVDPKKAGYILAVGVITVGTGGASTDTASARIQYDQSVRPPDSSVGPNSATTTVGGTSRPAQELSGLSNASRPGAHTCVYLFRTNGEGGARLETPDDYYCRASDEVPRAAITAMLKYVSKSTK
jgi:hypothetical protein